MSALYYFRMISAPLPFLSFLLISVLSIDAQCPCQNGGTCLNDVCQCSDGWTGKSCQRPCVDFYKSCEVWDEEGRCQWTKGLTNFFLDNCPVTCGQCKLDAKAVPKGPSLPPILEPLKPFVGVWQMETTFPDRYPIKFETGGYRETLAFAIADAPGFDTPSLNYTANAVSLVDETDFQREVGFLWMKPGNGSVKLVGNMMVVNSGLIVIQEGVLNNDVINFNITTYSQVYPTARILDQSELTNTMRTFDVSSPDKLIQMVKGSNGGRSYEKVYKKITENL